MHNFAIKRTNCIKYLLYKASKNIQSPLFLKFFCILSKVSELLFVLVFLYLGLYFCQICFIIQKNVVFHKLFHNCGFGEDTWSQKKKNKFFCFALDFSSLGLPLS